MNEVLSDRIIKVPTIEKTNFDSIMARLVKLAIKEFLRLNFRSCTMKNIRRPPC